MPILHGQKINANNRTSPRTSNPNMLFYTSDFFNYNRLQTKEVNIGGLLLGNGHPIRVQTMTTTDTMDTIATVEQTIRCIEAGAEMVRITAPSKKEAENLAEIRKELKKRGYDIPLIADIHFTPNAAEIAARIVQKVRVNPGNYIDKKKFDFIEYTDAEYAAEVDRIRERFSPLVKICKEYGTAMRIGTNHGSLSDRIMSRYGDTPIGMVESAMEFLRVARDENFHQIVLSMKSSNPQVMVQAYRLLVTHMLEEFGEAYPLHLGVTEAGDGEDGRIKSAIGIGSLLEDGIGDTIRVSLTEDPEFEIPVCRDIVARYTQRGDAHLLGKKVPQIVSKDHNTSIQEMDSHPKEAAAPKREKIQLPYSPFEYKRRQSFEVAGIGGTNTPVVVADLSKISSALQPSDLEAVGYRYDEQTDKWSISDTAADFIFTGDQYPLFPLPGTLRVIASPKACEQAKSLGISCFPIVDANTDWGAVTLHDRLNIVMIDAYHEQADQEKEAAAWLQQEKLLKRFANDTTVVFAIGSVAQNVVQRIRRMMVQLMDQKISNPVILLSDSKGRTPDEHLISFATETGGLLLDGFGDGICLGFSAGAAIETAQVRGRTYLPVKSIYEFTNNTAFSILQATRTRISKTEYISCPSCGRTLFDLQETTAKIRQVTNHLKGVKIAIMGCIVNGPGEMADADFGYVGSGPGKITLYKNKEVVKRNVPSETAVEALIDLLKEHGAWVNPSTEQTQEKKQVQHNETAQGKTKVSSSKTQFPKMRPVVLTDEETGAEAVVFAQMGAMLHSFQWKGESYIEGFSDENALVEGIDKSYHSSKLSPFPCRLKHGQYQWDGQTYQIEKLFSDGNAIHGLLFNKPFELLGEKREADGHTASFYFQYDELDSGYPFRYSCTITYRLLGTKLFLHTQLKNEGTKPIPIADGWHPYFQLGPSIDSCSLHFHSAGEVEFDDRLIPTGQIKPFEIFEQPTLLRGINLDNCYILAKPFVELKNEQTQRGVRFYPDGQYPYLQIYTPPHRKSIAIENLSAAPDVFNNKMGLKVLEPQEVWQLEVAYELF